MHKEPNLPIETQVRLLFTGHRKLEDLLAELVTLIGNRFEVDVCSIYLRARDRAKIILAATVGLNYACVGKLCMGLNEGLAGLVAQKMQPVSLEEAVKHPRYKYFPEAEEDAFESFLGVPIEGLGVLVVQSIEPRSYTSKETRHLKNLARLLGRHMCLREQEAETTIQHPQEASRVNFRTALL